MDPIKSYIADNKNRPETESFRGLWCSVIISAIHDGTKPARKNSRDTKRIRDNAHRWLFTSKITGIGSLNWICFMLDFDIQTIRQVAVDCISGKNKSLLDARWQITDLGSEY